MNAVNTPITSCRKRSVALGVIACLPSRCASLYLQDYLETKRVAFPRFYFVAPADLLDILSKGSNPQAILR